MITTTSGKPVNYDAYPFGKSEPVPSGYIYPFVKDQIFWAYGKFDIECPHCRKGARAEVGRLDHKLYVGKVVRRVKTVCRHCHTQVTFYWNGSTYSKTEAKNYL